MDFFRSILSDDPDPETLDNHDQSDTDHPQTLDNADEDDDSTSNLNSSDDGSTSTATSTTGAGAGLWSFGDLVKTLTTRSESVFETYRRDLKEFGTGLRKESDLFREVASRAVKELPASIDVDGVLKSTAEMIAQGKEALLAVSDVDDSDVSERRTSSDRSGFDSVRFSRFETQLNAIRSDVRGFIEDPEDLEDYEMWKLGFVVGEKRDEIEKLVGENGGLEAVYARVVPSEVDDATFWFRYFYKVHKLVQQEEMRAKLVNRSLSVDDEEELSWDVDDEDEEEKQEEEVEEDDRLRSNTLKDQDQSTKIVDKNIVEETKLGGGNVAAVEKGDTGPNVGERVDVKVESGEVKDGGVTVGSSQVLSQEEEDLEWDEIEDIGNADDKDVSHGEAANKVELRKRLSTAVDEEEDLSWDIEEDDDDEPVKTGNK